MKILSSNGKQVTKTQQDQFRFQEMHGEQNSYFSNGFFFGSLWAKAAQGKDDFWNANISTFTAFSKILQTKAIFLKNVFPLKSNPGQRSF